jgi:hypothetical protein
VMLVHVFYHVVQILVVVVGTHVSEIISEQD